MEFFSQVLLPKEFEFGGKIKWQKCNLNYLLNDIKRVCVPDLSTYPKNK